MRICATSLIWSVSAGKRRPLAAWSAAPASGARRARAATTTAATVSTRRTRKVLFFMASSESLAGALARLPGAQGDGGDAHEERHQADVEQVEAGAQPLDVLAPLVLDVTQVALRADDL